MINSFFCWQQLKSARYIMQPIYHPSNLKRIRKCGFRASMATPGGRLVLSAGRHIGRKKICVCLSNPDQFFGYLKANA
jgi:ribosomal protein L34